VIGRVGTLLGEAGVNIAEYHQARLAQGGQALAAVSVDGDVSEAIRAVATAAAGRSVCRRRLLYLRVSTDVSSDRAIRQAYEADSSGLQLIPELVARPETLDDVIELVKKAAADRTSVTSAGAQTSTTGASITDNGMLLSLRSLNRISDLDVKSRTVRVGPGAIVGEIKKTSGSRRAAVCHRTQQVKKSQPSVVRSRAMLRERALSSTARLEGTSALSKWLWRMASWSNSADSDLEKNTVGYAFAHDPIDWFIGSEGTLELS